MGQLSIEVALQESQLTMHEASFLDRASGSTTVILVIIGVSGFLFLVLSQRTTSASAARSPLAAVSRWSWP